MSLELHLTVDEAEARDLMQGTVPPRIQETARAAVEWDSVYEQRRRRLQILQAASGEPPATNASDPHAQPSGTLSTRAPEPTIADSQVETRFPVTTRTDLHVNARRLDRGPA